jgi:hypothetical protein
MFFGDVKMELDDWDDDIVEDKTEDFGKDLLAAEDNLGLMLWIELETKP